LAAVMNTEQSPSIMVSSLGAGRLGGCGRSLRLLPIPWELATLAFPFATVLYAAAGFLVGLRIGQWQASCGLATSLMFCLPGPGTLSDKARKVGAVLLVIVGSVIFSGLSVMNTSPDGEIYHRPAAILLADGWNPVFDSTIESVQKFEKPEARLNAWHVAFLPRASWIFGASLYRMVGFVEVADAFNVLTFVLAFHAVLRLLARMLGLSGMTRYAAAVLVTTSPTAMVHMFGGTNDCAMYSLFLIASVAATLYLVSGGSQWLGIVGMSFPLMANVKFTGVIFCGVIALVYLVGCTLRWRSGQAGADRPGRWILAVAASVLFATIMGFSPYVTSWVRYGGPFYPTRTFDKRIQLPATNVTLEFRSLNEDAKRMGHVGRFTYAYVSQSLALACYGKGSDGRAFAPQFGISGGVGGFGPVFRVAFIVALFMLPFVRLGGLGYLLASILITVALQPAMVVGYARYVPQFYAFPPLVLLAAAGQFGRCQECHRWMQKSFARASSTIMPISVAALVIFYFLPLVSYPLSMFGLQWIISVQNLELTNAMRENPAPIVLSNTFYSRHALTHDYGSPNARFLSSTQDVEAATAGLHRYQPYFTISEFGYSYFSPRELVDFPKLNHTVSGNDPKIIASRNRQNFEFFLFSFFPRQLMRLPSYVCDVAMLRWTQLGHAWLKPVGK
jgi:hypothetical protein